ncbi:MAG: hypothetical protein LWY06_11665 [Firmicutes bacterium]|nr:hypothetical protein [Bacillota bacterium]
MSAEIGILAGSEGPFPISLINKINEMNVDGIRAEMCKVNETSLESKIPYKLIIDRISHAVPFFLHYAKKAMIDGTFVINNPFRFYSDKFFGYCTAKELGIPVPRTVILPSRENRKGIIDADLTNIQTPVNWEEITEHIKFPAVLKPADGYGWLYVSIVKNMDELISAYEKSGQLVMTLQEYIDFDKYVRCFCLGKKYTMPIRYEPSKPHHERYVVDHEHLTPELGDKVVKYSIELSKVLDYDMNACEFAIKDGIPYAIDFINLVPDSHPSSIRPHYFDWVVETMAKVAVEYVQNPVPMGAWDEIKPIFKPPAGKLPTEERTLSQG